MPIPAIAQAVEERDLAALQRAINNKEEALQFIGNQLPAMGSDACFWFWKETTDDSFMQSVCSMMQEVCSWKLLSAGFIPGQDFSAHTTAGIPGLLVTPKARVFLLQAIPKERHSTLLASLRPIESHHTITDVHDRTTAGAA